MPIDDRSEPPVDPSDAPTPRLTKTWQVWVIRCTERAEELRAEELRLGTIGPNLNTARASLVRAARMLILEYRAAFARWVGPSGANIPTEQKAREQREYVLFSAAAKLLTQTSEDLDR